MDGILNINKPGGMTSFAVVAYVKRVTGEKHAGHAGTLDPLATGVLPVCLGQATRIIEFLFDQRKTYLAEIELGISTDTYDATGTLVSQVDASHVTRELLTAALAAFRGDIQQTPPMFSAVKFHGKPLYRLARSGVEVERRSRVAHVFSLEVTGWHPPLLNLEIECGKGTYVRSIAHDLGQQLGCGAYLKGLVRQKVGPLALVEAISLPDLAEAFRREDGGKHLYPLDHVLQSYPAVVFDTEHSRFLLQGKPVALTDSLPAARGDAGHTVWRAYRAGGSFLGMVGFDGVTQTCKPLKMFLKSSGLQIQEGKRNDP